MKLTDLFCYATLLVAFNLSLVQGDEDQELTKKSNHVIRKRETIVLYDNFPTEHIPRNKPKVIYRRISHQRHSPKPKYGPPRSKYRSSKPPRRPIKKYKKPLPTKYGPPSRKKPTKPRYGPPKTKPVYGPPKKYHQAFYVSEPTSFGEPPYDHYQDFSNTKQSFAEPPEDFQRPSIPKYNFYQIQGFNPSSFDDEQIIYNKDFKNWNAQSEYNTDVDYDFTEKHPIYRQREPQFDPSSPDEDGYMDQYKYRQFAIDEEPNFHERKRHPYYIDDIISMRPKKTQKPKTEPDPLVVGGQYAEPPARIVQKSYSNDSPYDNDDDFVPVAGYIDPDVAVSATMSPYVNYKNSNLAFSPQNLNDAFSIVDKK